MLDVVSEHGFLGGVRSIWDRFLKVIVDLFQEGFEFAIEHTELMSLKVFHLLRAALYRSYCDIEHEFPICSSYFESSGIKGRYFLLS